MPRKPYKIGFLFNFLANTTYSCLESGVVNITCTSLIRLTIVSAFYGVPACANCGCGYCACPNMTVTSIVGTICTNYVSCSFTATDSLFGDPCPSYGKTFILTYYCS